MSPALFDLKNLTACYGAREALRADELCIGKGGRYGVIGGNGSGKTTLLHVLAGLHAPASGTIHFNGAGLYRNAATLNSYRRKITCVFQKPVLFRGTVFSNVAYPLAVRRGGRSEIEGRVKGILEQLGLKGFEKRRSRSLSGGEMQRVAIARALVFRPEVLLVDEPTSSIDLAYRHVVMSLLSDFSRGNGGTLLFSTHDLDLANEYSDERIVLERGRVVSEYPENLFVVRVMSKESRNIALLPGGFEVVLPKANGDAGSVRIKIDPSLVRIEKDADGCGKILRIGVQEDFIRLTVDVGVPLTVFMKLSEYGAGNLAAGDKVGVNIPPEAVSISQFSILPIVC
ncbi:MAG: ABC transporter ATP-binding protein [Planctomycetota bacterium]|jgi:tungstate transport system ATP-binding protein